MPLHFDATAVRRQRRRDESMHGSAVERRSTPVAAKAIHYDATVFRRENNRGLAKSNAPSSNSRSATTSPNIQHPPGGESTTLPAVGQAAGLANRANSTTRESEHSDAPATPDGNITEFLVDLIVEQTGYPKESIELDWAFEADLGIDSIKKAQIFGELREYFDGDSAATLRLDDFVTLGDVVTLLKSTAGKTDWLEEPEVAHPSPAHQDPAVAADESDLATTLIDFVVEQTGFPREMVDLEADLESDLGIDSIKKAQLLGEMRELGGVELSKSDSGTQPFELDSIRSLADILALLIPANQVARDTSPTPVIAAATEQLGAHVDAPVQAPESVAQESATTVSAKGEPANSQAASSDTMIEMLIDFVVEQTGYPREIVELDADLEADLGIDSIKKAQLLGEVRDSVSLAPASLDAKLDLDKLKTLRDIASLISVQEITPAGTVSRTDNQTDSHPENSRNNTTAPDAPAVRPSPAALANVRNFVAWRSKELRAPIGPGNSAAPTSDAMVAFQDTLEPYVSWKTSPAGSVPSSPSELRSDSDAILDLPDWLMNTGNQPLEVRSEGDLRIVGVSGLERRLAFVNAEQGRAVLPIDENTTRSTSQNRLRLIAGLEGDIESASFQDVAIQTAANSACMVADARSESLWLLDRHGLRRFNQHRERLHGHSNGAALAPALRLACRGGCLILELHQGPYIREILSFPEQSGQHISTRQEETQTKLSFSERPLVLSPEELDLSGEITERFELRMVPSRQPEVRGRQPKWSGAAVVVGDNPVAAQLEARLKGCGLKVWRLNATNSDAAESVETSLRDQFNQLARDNVIPHLFLASPLDPAAQSTMSASKWQSRKPVGLMANFWLAQAWTQHVLATGMTDDGSLIAISGLGGDFGISGQSYSLEGAGINGMLKAVMIELWMQGHRCLPIKTLDTSQQQSPAEIVDQVWRELAIPSFDNEVSYSGGMRNVVRAIRRPAKSSTTRATPAEPSGTWVCTGGARGITAFVARQLATRFSLTLHLLGTASLDGFDPAWRDLDKEGLAQLKIQVLTKAHQQRQNSIQAWQDTEKLIEIDATLQQLAQAGVEAHYHVCDCSDIRQVEETLADVRRVSGPITGILHGAGIGKDSRFEAKQPKKVHQCFAAKVDGALALMEATEDDPIKHFLGFGSISGRFGANGHTDYSAANDMLCKQIAWYQRRRPEVRAIGFHWHAWGDVGMATKPETKLALEMIDMEFMPAKEGIRHIVRELACDSDQTEVLITDDRYYRAFYPAESLPNSGPGLTAIESTSSSGASIVSHPLLSSPVQINDRAHEYKITVNPARDPFLTEHVLDGRPLLPIAVAAEILAEAGEAASGRKATRLQNLTAVSALKFFHDGQQELSVRADRRGEIDFGRNADEYQCELASQFVGRTGIASSQLRCNFTSDVIVSDKDNNSMRITHLDQGDACKWQRAGYPQPKDKFYVGWSLQKLRKYSFVHDGLIGKIVAPILIELAGNRKDTSHWRIPSAALDACLFATGIFAWNRIRPGVALPARIDRLSLGRRPRPGEACEVHLRPTASDNTTADFNFTLFGVDGEMILNAEGYRVAWLTAGGAEALHQSGSPYSEHHS
ncbi:MAG TPA: hypothetical protein DDW52_19335 [Planctomycetaceae bacterium]|nr:hypothetical protein [Planctomycetaceae bacterium]